jgi:hypothetical protein
MKVEQAIKIAELWEAGKMIGGDEGDVRNTLLHEVERLTALAAGLNEAAKGAFLDGRSNAFEEAATMVEGIDTCQCCSEYEISARIRRLGGAVRPLAWPIKGVRVEGDRVVVAVKGGNDAARWLCGELVAMIAPNKPQV